MTATASILKQDPNIKIGSTDGQIPKTVKSKPMDANSLFLVGDCPFLELLPIGPNADGQPGSPHATEQRVLDVEDVPDLEGVVTSLRARLVGEMSPVGRRQCELVRS